MLIVYAFVYALVYAVVYALTYTTAYARSQNLKIRIRSDCSENLHTVKTIIITTPKKNLGVGGFSTYFLGI